MPSITRLKLLQFLPLGIDEIKIKIIDKMTSKINITQICVYLPISNSVVANLLAHNNISQICYCGQISLQTARVNCSYSDNLTPMGVTFIYLRFLTKVQPHKTCLS